MEVRCVNMIQNKLILKIITIIMLIMLTSVNISAFKPLNLHSVYGYLYINDVEAPEGVEVILSFSNVNETDITDHNGYYQIDFNGHDGQTGEFFVLYLDIYYIPEGNPEVFIFPQQIGYSIDLHITVSGNENSPPYKPETPNPENNSESISLNPTLSVLVIDPDDDTMNVSFFDASDDSLVGTNTNVVNGGTASVEWQGLSYNTTYFWYAIANDSEDETRSDTWNFKTIEELVNNPPDKPTDPIPENNAVNVSLNPTLSVNVTDPDDDTMNVSFFNASDDSLIGTDINVPSGGTASIIWSDLSLNTTYYWYAVAIDYEFQTISDTWQFTTADNNPPDKPTDPNPMNNSVDIDLSPTLSVLVIDIDDDSMDVSFYDASDDSLIGTDTNVPNGSTASIVWSGLSYGTTYLWYAVADDSLFETRSDTWQFTTKTNNPPDKPTDPDPVDNQEDVGLNPTLSVLVTDPDNDLMTVAFYNSSDNTLIGMDYNVASGTRASAEWQDLSYDTNYRWYVIVGDSIYSTKSDTWSFKTVENKNPTVKIVKPERGLYIFNRKIWPRFIRPALIIGKITIEAEANDEDGSIEKVEFYINGKLKKTDDIAPYSYDWTRDRLRLIHRFTIKVVAYDDADATATQKMIVRKFL